jgi:HAD superfamily phosphoserine phosphatase-like hydrolase
MSAPENIGAFFDLDGTLLPPPSLEWRFIGYLLERDQISRTHVANWLAHFAKAILRDPHQAIEGNKFYLAGINESLVSNWESELACATSPEDSVPLLEQGLQRIHWHHAQGHRIFLITGTLAPLAQMIARRISAQLRASIEVRATQLEVSPERWHSHRWLCSSNQWTGRLTGDHMSNKVKSHTLKTAAATHNLDLAKSYAYGDSTADVPMLESAAYAHAVNPSRRLASIALQHNWPTFHWKQPAPTILEWGGLPPPCQQRFGTECSRSAHQKATHHSIRSTKSAKI